MKLNLIPDLILINERGERFKIITQQAVIRIGDSVLIKNDFDIRDELEKFFEKSKESILELEYHPLDQNLEHTEITIKKVYINTYEVREYYNAEMDKNDMIYMFSVSGENTKELIEEYRHRQIVESLKEQKSKEIKFIDEATLERLLNEVCVKTYSPANLNTKSIKDVLV